MPGPIADQGLATVAPGQPTLCVTAAAQALYMFKVFVGMLNAGLSARERARLKRLAKKRPAQQQSIGASSKSKRKKGDKGAPLVSKEVRTYSACAATSNAVFSHHQTLGRMQFAVSGRRHASATANRIASLHRHMLEDGDFIDCVVVRRQTEPCHWQHPDCHH